MLVIVGSPIFPTFVPAALLERSQLRVVQWVYDLYPEALLALDRRSNLLRTLALPTAIALNRAWRAADAVVAISPSMATRIRQRAPEARVCAIPLWAPAGIEPTSDRSRALRQARGIDENAFVVMYHGNLGLAYDFEPVFTAAGILAKDAGVVFAIVGEGAQRATLNAWTKRLPNVRLFPPAADADLSESLAMGDCHIVSVRHGWDGLAFPSKFISALAAERPVLLVGPRETEIAEMVFSNGCGVAVAPEGEALAAAVRRLRDHRQEAVTQGAAGRALYERVFDRARVLAQWDALAASLGQRDDESVFGDPTRS